MQALEGIHRSTDRGASFASFPAPFGVGSVAGIAFDRAAPQTYYAATSDGVWAYTMDKSAAQSHSPTATKVAPAQTGGGAWTKVASLPLPLKWPVSLAVAPTDPNRLIAAGPTYGADVSRLYASADRGKTWVPLTCDVDVAVSVVGFNAADPQIVYALISFPGQLGEGHKTPDRNVVCADVIKARGKSSSLGEKYGLYRSSDGGKTWTLSLDNPVGVALSSRDPNVLYAIAGYSQGMNGDTVYKTTDRGKTWKIMGKRPSDGESWTSILIVSPADPSLALIGSNTGVYRSADGGASWSRVFDVGVTNLAFTDLASSVIATTEGRGAALSTDGGKTWQPSDSDLGYSFGSRIANPLDLREVFVVAENGAVLRSADGGRSFSQLGQPFGDAGVSGLTLDQAKPQTLYAVVGDGLWAHKLGKAVAAVTPTPMQTNTDVVSPTATAAPTHTVVVQASPASRPSPTEAPIAEVATAVVATATPSPTSPPTEESAFESTLAAVGAGALVLAIGAIARRRLWRLPPQ